MGRRIIPHLVRRLNQVVPLVQIIQPPGQSYPRDDVALIVRASQGLI